MKKTLLVCALAAVALAVPGTAFAHGGHHGHHGHNARRGFAAFKRDLKHGVVVRQTAALGAALSGTGTTFGATTASSSGSIAAGTLAGGTYTASVTTDWTKATTKTFKSGTFSCAPATATLTIASSTNSASTSLTGKTCSWTSNGKTAYVFAGSGAAAGSGTLAGLTGTEHVALREDSTGAVRGTALAGSTAVEPSQIVLAVTGKGHCDNH